MSAEVDIKQLAIVREPVESPRPHRRPQVVSRYVIPGVLVAGFMALVAWAARDVVLPPRQVWVVPVLASQSLTQSEGTPLFQAAGWIEPRPTPIRVAALAPGVVERLLVVEDQAVKAGEPIAELVAADAQLSHDAAGAQLRLREAELAQVKAGLQAATTRFEQPVHLQAALSESEAALAELSTELKNLPYELRRAKSELESATAVYDAKRGSEGVVPARSIQEAKSARDATKAMVEELQNRGASLARQELALHQRRDAVSTQLKLLAEERQAKDEATAKVQAAAARVEQAQIALAEAALRLARMTVRSPVDGRVYQLVAYPGSTLVGGMGPVPNSDGSTVVTLYRPEMLQIRVDVRFEDIPKMSLGQPVLVNNPALSVPIAGKVLFVSSEANIQKNTLEVKVAMDSPVAVFKPEMLVEVTFLAPKPVEALADNEGQGRLYVPQQLVTQEGGKTYVWVADRSAGVARKTAVTIGGLAAGGLVEVTQGLDAASRVIARGTEGLEDGDRIRLVSEDTESLAGSLAGPQTHQPLRRLPQEGE